MYNSFNPEISIVITTFLRENCLKRLVDSILEYQPNIKIYLADQGNTESNHPNWYDDLVSKGHQIVYLPYDCGICYAKNKLTSYIQTPYVIFLEDDLIFTQDTKLLELIKLFKYDEKIGAIGFQEKDAHFEYWFDFSDQQLFYVPVHQYMQRELISYTMFEEMKFVYCDIVQNFAIYRIEVLNSLWDMSIKNIEHTDTFLNIKYNTKWKVIYTPDAEIMHRHDSSNNIYNKLRSRRDDLNYIYNKWNIKGFIHLDKVLGQLIPAPKTEIVIKPIESIYLVFRELINLFDAHKINFCLLKDTCLDMIKERKLNSARSTIFIGVVAPLPQNFIEILHKNKYETKNGILIKNGIKIHIEKYTRPLKFITVENQNLQVPYPVIGYLTLHYGKSWGK